MYAWHPPLPVERAPQIFSHTNSMGLQDAKESAIHVTGSSYRCRVHLQISQPRLPPSTCPVINSLTDFLAWKDGCPELLGHECQRLGSSHPLHFDCTRHLNHVMICVCSFLYGPSSRRCHSRSSLHKWWALGYSFHRGRWLITGHSSKWRAFPSTQRVFHPLAIDFGPWSDSVMLYNRC